MEPVRTPSPKRRSIPSSPVVIELGIRLPSPPSIASETSASSRKPRISATVRDAVPAGSSTAIASSRTSSCTSGRGSVVRFARVAGGTRRTSAEVRKPAGVREEGGVSSRQTNRRKRTVLTFEEVTAPFAREGEVA